jgi:hypothetical protein
LKPVMKKKIRFPFLPKVRIPLSGHYLFLEIFIK